MLRIGNTAPDFEVETTEGSIRLHSWLGDTWGLLFSHPKDFTPVCTTELGEAARLHEEFLERNCKLIGLSIDSVADHRAWLTDIRIAAGQSVRFPIIADENLEVAKLYGMLPASAGASAQGRTAAENRTVRSVFFIAPDKTIRAMLTYPMTSGRSFSELLRLLESLQLTDRHPVATPAGWSAEDDVIIAPAVSNDEAKVDFPMGWRGPLPYLRFVKRAWLGTGNE